MATLVQHLGTGRRKKAVARVFLRPGSGNITVNGRPYNEYFTTETARAVVRQPLLTTETADKFDILILANGGGFIGQADAAKLGISRALVEFNSELRTGSRYQSVTTLDEVDFEGRRCYKIGLTRKTGGEDIEFYDVATGLRTGRIATRESLLGPVTTTLVETDYKRFGNLVQPSTVRIQGGGVVQVIRIAWTEYDRVPPSIFELPPQIIALVR